MKTWISCCLACLLGLPFSQGQNGAIGDWMGSLNLNGQTMRIVFHIEVEEQGVKATMDSPDQGAYGLPCNSVKYQKPELTIQMDALNLQYQGRLNDQDQFVGTVTQNGMEFDLTLSRTTDQSAAPTPPARPQTPKGPFPYDIQEVQFKNKKANIQLAGTVTIPKDCKACPAAILISGSGPQDRNETLLGHEPFWVIADYLSRRGIAVLRFDDRGVGQSEGDFATATSADFMTDVAAGLEFLKQHAGVDGDKIGLIGHSEGGLIAPMLAARNEEVAFIISLAGPGVAGRDLLPEQIRLIAQANGLSEEAVQQQYTSNQKACALIATSTNDEQLRQDLTDLLTESGLSVMQLDHALEQYTHLWFQYFMRYDPRSDWQQVRCPVLALNGAKDLQVPADVNLEGIAQALKHGNNQQVTTQKLDHLNHLFQTCKTGAPSEYNSIEETFSPKALLIMEKWINKLW